jgi:glutathione S-transferase
MNANVRSGQPVLWQLGVSIFSEKARWALDYKSIRHRRRTLTPGLHAITLRLRRQGGTVPVLDFEGRSIRDSTSIIAALEAARPNPSLYPHDAAERAGALELEDFFDERCGHDLRRITLDSIVADPHLAAESFMGGTIRPLQAVAPFFIPLARPVIRRHYGVDSQAVEQARTRLVEAFDHLERQLGSNDYLAGQQFTVADLTAAAILAHLVLPPEYPYPMIGAERLPADLRDFRDSLSHRAGFEWVREMYRRHRGVSMAGDDLA